MTTIKVEIPEKLTFLFSPSRYKVAHGGRGGAKSWGFARALLIMAYQRPLRVLCAREFQNSIQESVHRLLSEQVDALGLSAHYSVLQSTIRGANGSEFMFAGLKSDPTKIKSAEGYDICWVEEAEKVSAQSWDILIPTIRKDGSEIWVSFNPHIETDSTYQRFIVNTPPNAVVAEISWRDNPWFPPELEKERAYLQQIDPEAYLHIWEGHCLKVGDNQLIGISEAIEASRRIYKEQDIAHAPIVLGVDVARYGGDRSVIFRRRGLVAFDPIVFNGIDNMTLAGRVAQEIESHDPDAVFIDAGRGEGVIDRLRQLGYSVTDINFGGKPRSDKYANKRAEMWVDMANWIKERGCIPNINDLHRDLASPTYQFSNSNNKFSLESKELIKARGGKSPDLADALALTFAFPVVPKAFVGRSNTHQTLTDYNPLGAQL